MKESGRGKRNASLFGRKFGRKGLVIYTKSLHTLKLSGRKMHDQVHGLMILKWSSIA